jgi:hypothetical protein
MPLLNEAPIAFALPDVHADAAGGRDIECIRQEQVNWCWAACIEMISTLSSHVAQPEIVNLGLGRTDCRIHAGGSDCNVRIPIAGPRPSVEATLRRMQRQSVFVPDALSPGAACRRIDDTPVIAGFNAAGNGGHVVLLIAWDEGASPDDPLLLENDPNSSPPHQAWRTYDEVFAGLGLGFGFWSSTLHSIG